MATVVNKAKTGTPPVGNATVEVLASVNTPDFPSAGWIQNPDLSALIGVSRLYWKLPGDGTVVEMTAPEKASVDAALLPPVLDGGDDTEQTNATTTPASAVSLALSANQARPGQYLAIWYAEIATQNLVSNSGVIAEIEWQGVQQATSSNPTNQWVEFSGARLVNILPDTAYTLEFFFYRAGAANTAKIRRIFVALIPRQSLGLLPPSGG